SAKTGIGTAAEPLLVTADQLTTDTSAGDSNQFITESNGLTQVDLKAGVGNVTLSLTAGALLDTDTNPDLICRTATVALLAPTAQDFGAAVHPINTDVRNLSVSTSAGGGSQFITEANDLSALDLN